MCGFGVDLGAGLVVQPSTTTHACRSLHSHGQPDFAVPKVAPVILEYPTYERNDGDANADDADPESDRKTQEAKCGGSRQHEWPPAPRAEVALLCLTVINVGVVSVLGQHAPLCDVDPA